MTEPQTLINETYFWFDDYNKMKYTFSSDQQGNWWADDT